jgi:hypothetical protein
MRLAVGTGALDRERQLGEVQRKVGGRKMRSVLGDGVGKLGEAGAFVLLAQLVSRLNEPKRAIDIFGALFARKIGPDLLGMATGEAIAHLNCLVGRGLARRVADEQGITRYVAT